MQTLTCARAFSCYLVALMRCVTLRVPEVRRHQSCQ